MSDISPRRRFAGRALLAGAALALPLTASITYAAQDPAPVPPAAPAAPEAPPATYAPEAPLAPHAPTVPETPEVDHADGEHRVVVRRIERDGEPVRIVRRVYRGDRLVNEDISGELGHEMTAEERAEFEREMAEMREELRRELGPNGEMQREIGIAVAEARAGAAHAVAHAPKVVMSCRDGDQPVPSETDENGKTTLFVCETAGDRIALRSLQRTRASIAGNSGMADDVRAEVLRSLDAEIARLSE